MSTGKAYAFFGCRATKDQIEGQLPLIRGLSQAPENLQLTLYGIDNFGGDIEFSRFITPAKKRGNEYVLEAAYPAATNEETADNLAAIMNNLYSGSPLFEKGDEYRGEIVYKKGDKFMLRD